MVIVCYMLTWLWLVVCSMMQRLMAKPKEELVVDTLTQAQAHLHDWPANRPRPSPLANDTFKLQHARIIKACFCIILKLCTVSPRLLSSAFVLLQGRPGGLHHLEAS